MAARAVRTAAAAAERVCIIGSGNWGSAIARIVGANVVDVSPSLVPTARKSTRFDSTVQMWVYEEMWNGKKLTEVINEKHENVKYLPGVTLPDNVIANPDLVKAVTGASLLVFVLPHQFLKHIIPQIKPVLRPEARAISLIKGIDFDDSGLVLISDVIRRGLGIDVSVLMGANVAKEVAKDEFSEATVGGRVKANTEVWKELFNTDYFHIETTTDTAGVELCGALKNIVAIGAGFVDGLGFGGNTKAAIIRIGLVEMMRFCRKYYDGVLNATFFESCGVADIITTCYGGRNRKCAEAFVTTGKPWEELEQELLGGQKLQGTLTAFEVHKVLEATNDVDEFPFFKRVYEIAYKGVSPSRIVELDAPVSRL